MSSRRFGLCRAGSSAGLMAMLVGLGVMSITWMVVIGVLVFGQQLLPAKSPLSTCRCRWPSPGLEC
jgi:predicted metal-binding membrane protein